MNKVADAVYDYSGVLDGLTGMVPAFVAAAGGVLLAALGVAGVMWGFPKLIGLFRKTAK